MHIASTTTGGWHMQGSANNERPNRFVGEVRDNGGYGLTYRTASGRSGIIWLVYPDDADMAHAGQLSILGEYLRIDADTCKVSA